MPPHPPLHPRLRQGSRASGLVTSCSGHRRLPGNPSRQDHRLHSKILSLLQTLPAIAVASVLLRPQRDRASDPMAQGRVDRLWRLRPHLHRHESRLRRASGR
ncbi:hypothetical protein ACLB2K_073574 [Fragaria x ananassa]